MFNKGEFENIVKETLKNANKINVKGIFCQELEEFLENECLRVGIPFEFILPGLLATVSHLMEESIISVSDDHVESCVMYTGLIANPATGKSQSLTFFEKAINEIEKYNETNVSDSKLVKGATVEALCSILEDNNCILSLFDESSAFYGSFGRYSNGGASYERSIYLELFNGKSTFKRDLKKEKTRIYNPRLNICLLGHPQYFVKAMREEQATRDDGLMQRFLFCSPKPCFYDAHTIQKAQMVPRLFSFTVLLYLIKVQHEQKIKQHDNQEDDKISINKMKIIHEDNEKKTIKYKFDSDAEQAYLQYYSEFREISAEMNEHDVFISSMYGKAIVHMIRISSIISCLHNAFNIIMKLDVPNKIMLQKEIDLKLTDQFKSFKDTYVISRDNLIAAKQLVEYFILNRLILAGYQANFSFDSVHKIIQSILNKIKCQQSIINKKLLKIILIQEGNQIECNEIIHSKKGGKEITAQNVIDAFKTLQARGIGIFEERKNKKGPSTKIFIKNKIENDTSNKDDLIDFLETIDIDLLTYNEQIEKKKTVKNSKQSKMEENKENISQELSSISNTLPNNNSLTDSEIESYQAENNSTNTNSNTESTPISNKHRLDTLEKINDEKESKEIKKMKASKKQQKTDINADNSQLIELTNSLCSPSPQPTRNTRQCKTNKKNSSLD